MQTPEDGWGDHRPDDDDAGEDDDVLALLAPGAPLTGTPPPPLAPRRPPTAPAGPTPPPVPPPVPPPRPTARPDVVPRADPPPLPPLASPPAPPGLPPAVAPPAAAALAVGRWFQPVPGGVLPHPSPADPRIADLPAAPGVPVHAVTSARVRRAPPQAGGALELHARDGATFVYTGPATVAWTVDDEEEVAAGAVLGVVAGSRGDPPLDSLLVVAVDAAGAQVDAVALLVGLPDPGELALRPEDDGLGADPYLLDLEIAGRAELRGTP